MADRVRVASVKDIPAGEARIVKAKDTEIALCNVGGAFHAVDNTCPHRGGPLAEGALEGPLIACPWHGWQFDVTTGCYAVNPSMKIRRFAVQVKGDDVFVEI